MRAARFFGKGDIRVEDIPEPQPEDGKVLIDVAWGGICGTDLREYLHGAILVPRPGKPHPLTGDTLPVTLGHEFCGHIYYAPTGAKGADGSDLKVGMAVMVDPRLNCRSCFSCRKGSTNLCGRWGFLGLHGGGGGGLSEQVAVSQHMLYSLPSSVKIEDAALIEPLAVGRHALAVTGVTGWSGLAVLVIGGGPVGMSVLINLRTAGATRVFLSEPTVKRQEQNREFADQAFNPMRVKVAEECRKLTDGQGVDFVFDCAGIAPGMMDGMAALKPRGTYVNVAGWDTPFTIPMGLFMVKELTLKTSMAYDDRSFGDTVKDFVAGNFKGAEKMITARIPLESVKERGFERLIKNKDEEIKILVTPRR